MRPGPPGGFQVRPSHAIDCSIRPERRQASRNATPAPLAFGADREPVLSCIALPPTACLQDDCSRPRRSAVPKHPNRLARRSNLQAPNSSNRWPQRRRSHRRHAAKRSVLADWNWPIAVLSRVSFRAGRLDFRFRSGDERCHRRDPYRLFVGAV